MSFNINVEGNHIKFLMQLFLMYKESENFHFIKSTKVNVTGVDVLCCIMCPNAGLLSENKTEERVLIEHLLCARLCLCIPQHFVLPDFYTLPPAAAIYEAKSTSCVDFVTIQAEF